MKWIFARISWIALLAIAAVFAPPAGAAELSPALQDLLLDYIEAPDDAQLTPLIEIERALKASGEVTEPQARAVRAFVAKHSPELADELGPTLCSNGLAAFCPKNPVPADTTTELGTGQRLAVAIGAGTLSATALAAAPEVASLSAGGGVALPSLLALGNRLNQIRSVAQWTGSMLAMSFVAEVAVGAANRAWLNHQVNQRTQQLVGLYNDVVAILDQALRERDATEIHASTLALTQAGVALAQIRVFLMDKNIREGQDPARLADFYAADIADALAILNRTRAQVEVAAEATDREFVSRHLNTIDAEASRLGELEVKGRHHHERGESWLTGEAR